jgi:hypothetical protein
MKSAILLAAALALAAPSYAADGVPAIVGKWTWTRSENACTEIYDYRADGTLYVHSGDEKTDNTYSMESAPDENGFFRMALKIVKDYGGKDCADSEEDDSGQEQVVYVLFHSSKSLHAICRDPNLDNCYGPLHRVKE